MGIRDEKAVEKFGSKDLEINPNWTHSSAVHKNSDVPWNFWAQINLNWRPLQMHKKTAAARCKNFSDRLTLREAWGDKSRSNAAIFWRPRWCMMRKMCKVEFQTCFTRKMKKHSQKAKSVCNVWKVGKIFTEMSHQGNFNLNINWPWNMSHTINPYCDLARRYQKLLLIFGDKYIAPVRTVISLSDVNSPHFWQIVVMIAFPHGDILRHTPM